jgi:hypothetical protein
LFESFTRVFCHWHIGFVKNRPAQPNLAAMSVRHDAARGYLPATKRVRFELSVAFEMGVETQCPLGAFLRLRSPLLKRGIS